MPLLAELFDDGARRPVIYAVHETIGFFVDDRECFLDFFLSCPAILLTGRFQVINIIQEDIIVDLANSRLKIAWCPEIQDEKRFVS